MRTFAALTASLLAFPAFAAPSDVADRPDAAQQTATPDGKAPDREIGGDKKGKGGGKKGKKGKKDGNWTGPFKKDEYPIKEIKRPLVLPDGMGEVGVGANVTSFAGTTSVSLAPSFHYGVADVVDFGVSTSLLLSPDVAWSKGLPIDAHYLAVDTEKFDWAPGIVLPLTFQEGAGFGVLLDLPGRYVINDTVFVTFGQGAVPLRFSPDFTLSLAGNGGLGFQVDKAVALGFQTSVFQLNLAPDANLSGLWDFLNLNLYGQYSVNRMVDIRLDLGVFSAWGVDNSTIISPTLSGVFRF